MTTHIKSGGVWREASEVHIKDGGVWRECTNVYVKNSGVWREVFTATDPLTVSIPTSLSDANNTPDDAQVVITPTINGGVTPYTYLWQQVVNNGDITHSSTSGSTLTLTMDTDTPTSQSETWNLRVTDNEGTVKTSGNCVVTLRIDP